MLIGSKVNIKSLIGNKNTSSNLIGSKSHFGRKASNTLNKINEYAIPALAIGSALQPELSPLFGTIGAGLKGIQSLSNNFRQF